MIYCWIRKKWANVKFNYSLPNYYQKAKKGKFKIEDIDKDNINAILRGLLHETSEEKKAKLKEIIETFYANPSWFFGIEKDEETHKEFQELFSRSEIILGYCVKEESFDLEKSIFHLTWEMVNENIKTIKESIKKAQGDKLIIFLERILEVAKNQKDSKNILIKLFEITPKEDWRIYGVFALYAEKLPDEIKYEIRSYEDKDIEKFIKEKLENLDFYESYFILDIDALFKFAGRISETDTITLSKIGEVLSILHVDPSYKNQKVFTLLEIIQKTYPLDAKEENQEFKQKMLEASANESKKVDKTTEIIKKILDSYKNPFDNQKTFSFVKYALSEERDEKLYKIVTLDLAKEKAYELAYKSFGILAQQTQLSQEEIFYYLVSSSQMGKLDKNLYAINKSWILKEYHEEILKIPSQHDNYQKYFLLEAKKLDLLDTLHNGDAKALLLLAKYEALDEKVETITRKHVKKALGYFAISEAFKPLLQETKIKPLIGKYIVNDAMIEKLVSSNTKLPFDEEAKLLVSVLRKDPKKRYVTLIKDVTAKDILLLAKYFAMEDKSEFITQTHLQQALSSIKLHEEALLKEFKPLMEVLQYDVRKAIEKASKGAKINYEEALKTYEKLQWLKANLDSFVGTL